MFYLEISSWYDCRQFQLKKYVRSTEELSAVGRISVMGIIWRHYAYTWKKWLKNSTDPEMLVQEKKWFTCRKGNLFLNADWQT